MPANPKYPFDLRAQQSGTSSASEPVEPDDEVLNHISSLIRPAILDYEDEVTTGSANLAKDLVKRIRRRLRNKGKHWAQPIITSDSAGNIDFSWKSNSLRFGIVLNAEHDPQIKTLLKLKLGSDLKAMNLAEASQWAADLMCSAE